MILLQFILLLIIIIYYVASPQLSAREGYATAVATNIDKIQYVKDIDTNNIVHRWSEITFKTNPQKSGDIYCNGELVSNITKKYNYGVELNCQTQPEKNFGFNYWSGIYSNSSNFIRFIASQNGTLIANFSDAIIFVHLTKLFSHPIAILIIGAIVSSILIPYFTRKWQNHQKELELKTTLVEKISNIVTGIIIAVILEVGGVKNPTEPNAIIKAYRDWEITSAAIQSFLQAYFPDSEAKITERWRTYSDIINDFYYAVLGQDTNEMEKHSQNIKTYFPSMDNTINGIFSKNAYERSTSIKVLAERILNENNSIIKIILNSRISGF